MLDWINAAGLIRMRISESDRMMTILGPYFARSATTQERTQPGVAQASVAFLFAMLALAAGLLESQTLMAAPTFEQIFEAGLHEAGLKFQQLEPDLYRVETTDASSVRAYTGNVRRNFERSHDPAVVDHFISMLRDSTRTADLPAWPDAASGLFPMIESTEVQFESTVIARPLSGKTIVALVHYSPETHSVHFITPVDLGAWKITEQQAWAAAEAAMAKTVGTYRVEVREGGEFPVGLIHAPEPYKASAILSAALKERLKDTLGWPVYAVAPCRDFVMLMRKKDHGYLGRVGDVVLREFKDSAYPLSTEVWELSDAGAKAIGEFPIP